MSTCATANLRSQACKEAHPSDTYCDACCDHSDEACSYEDDSECVVCRSCKEWTSEVKCKYCEETLFQSACCG